MARTLSYDRSLAEPPTEAQARLRAAVTYQIRQAADMRPANEAADSLAFARSGAGH